MADKKKLADELRPASFRGVPFKVEASDIGAGRRTQLNEYPQRDKPYVEDLGRATREIGLVAFVVGEDYIAQANAVLGALEEPGPGTLIHPWFGELTVSLKDLARVAFDPALGQARITMQFIESGELAFPSSETSTQAASRIAAGKLEKASVESFAEKFGVKGFQDFVAAAASGNLGKMLGIVGLSEVGKVLGFANSLAKTVSTAISLISNPKTLGWKLMGAFGLSGLATTVAAWSNIVRQLSRVGKSSSLKTPTASSIATPSRKQANANAAAVYALGRQAIIAQAVGASSLVGSNIDSSTQLVTASLTASTAGSTVTSVMSYNDMIAVRDELIAAIDQESLTADDAVYEALQTARSAVWRDLTTRTKDSARLTTLTPPETAPALVLAYDYYEDAARDSEIIARNAVRHPGFVPPVALRVLTR